MLQRDNALSIGGDKYPFSWENINTSPNRHGVYALYNGYETVYIGRASGINVTIRSRMSDHKSGREGPGTQASSHYRREVTEAAISREKELLQEYVREHGRLPRFNEVMP